MVGVLPTHRRRGILRRMMAQQLRDIHERGEPLAILVSSESSIYGRFGYGIGSLQEDWTIAHEHGAFASAHEQPGRLRLIEPTEARGVLPEVYDRVAARRPGMVNYPPAMWDLFMIDQEGQRSRVLYEEGGQALGYAKFRVTNDALLVQELMATTHQAYASLWRFCLDHDLVSCIKAQRRPVDDALPWMLADPRRLRRVVSDRMWLRLVDVQAALSGRRYMNGGRVLLGVRDPVCAWNERVYELDASDGGAQCRRSTETADLVLAAADLAASYLGAVRFTTLARAGRVEEGRPGSLLVADAMFTTELQPWAPYNL